MAKEHCKGRTTGGAQCRAYPNQSGYCFTHDVTKGKERAQARRNGGRCTKKPHGADAATVPSTVNGIGDVLAVLNYALQETIILDNSIQRGRLLVSLAHGYIEALKVGELEQRIEAIELALKVRL